jgi:heat shock protein HslJ
MKENNILIDSHPNDYIIRLSPFVDEKGNWTGELMVGTISTEDNVMNDTDHYQLMHLTQMVCASIPAMEENEDFRELLTEIVDDTVSGSKEEESKITGVDENIISVKFH